MKRSSSAPCLADEESTGSKKVREDLDEPTGREYLQLALARVLELQRQVKDDTYRTDNTSDLGESDSEEDVMKEVLIKVFKDLPGSSPAVTAIINRATRSQPPQILAIRDKRIQLSGYDTCRRVALDFMNTVVKNTRTTECDSGRFEMGTFSKIETKMADHRMGLTENPAGQSRGESSKNDLVDGQNILQDFGDDKLNTGKKSSAVQNSSRNYIASGQNFPRGGIAHFGQLRNGYYKESVNNSKHYPQRQVGNSLAAEENEKNVNRGLNKFSENSGNGKNVFQEVKHPARSLLNLAETERQPTVSREYEIRIRMLKGLDLHLATKQRDFTARLMRQ